MKQKFKNFIKSKLIPRLHTPEHIENILKLLPSEIIVDQVTNFGTGYRKVRSLKMESAPGTVEGIIDILKNESKSRTLLDYGCGPHQSKYLKILGFNVSSCDIVNFGGEGFTQINKDDKRLPYKDKQFDISVVSEVIEHVYDPWTLLQEVFRVTGDYVIVSTPNVVSSKSKRIFNKTNYLNWFQPKDFDYHVTPVFYWQMENFCKKEGVRIADMVGNHTIFTNDRKNILKRAETLIFKIELSA